MAAGKFDLASDYNDVRSRMIEFREKHPEGSLQQVSLDFREVAGGWWVVYTAAAYRTPDDARPGHGTAWEPVPGKTPFTRDSELQNAETAAWGRAIMAALAADAKKGIASAEEVRNRQAPPLDPTIAAQERVLAAWRHRHGDTPTALPDIAADYAATHDGADVMAATAADLTAYAETLETP